ncbi:MAG: hypothetical protein JW716_01400 [Candidatus Aenigmarchaeota archaeon]|nr:hypothetical protein [Candidatus Aenigmarchaeota archaeon]
MKESFIPISVFLLSCMLLFSSASADSEITLGRGWNAVYNSYGIDIPMSSLRSCTNLFVFSLNNNALVPVTIMEKGNAYLIRATGQCSYIIENPTLFNLKMLSLSSGWNSIGLDSEISVSYLEDVCGPLIVKRLSLGRLVDEREYLKSGNAYLVRTNRFCEIDLLNYKPGYEPLQDDKIANQPDNGDRITRGKYTCDGCPEEGYEWYIDENHMLWWDGEPYIPFGTNTWQTNQNVELSKQKIDRLFEVGLTDMHMLGSCSGDIFGEEGYSNETLMSCENYMKQLIDYVNEKGGRYILMYSIGILKNRFNEPQYPAFEFWEKTETQNSFRDDMKRIALYARTPGLRAVQFAEEIANNDPLNYKIEKYDIGRLQNVLDTYGKIIKEELGDVPVVMNIDRGHLDLLHGLNADNFDGVIGQFPAALPDEAEFRVKRAPMLPFFNSCAEKTKLFWGYQQGFVTKTFAYHPTKDIMKESNLRLSKHGVTGFPYEFKSSMDYMVCQHEATEAIKENLEDDNLVWYGEIKEDVIKDVLMRVGRDEYTKLQNEDLCNFPPAEPDIDKETITEIARKQPSAEHLIEDLGVNIVSATYDPGMDYWNVQFGKQDNDFWYLMIRDKKEGEIFDGIDLTDLAREYYPIPDDVFLRNCCFKDCCSENCNDNEYNQPCNVGSETGKTCDTKEHCSTGEFVEGCCILGTCNI